MFTHFLHTLQGHCPAHGSSIPAKNAYREGHDLKIMNLESCVCKIMHRAICHVKINDSTSHAPGSKSDIFDAAIDRRAPNSCTVGDFQMTGLNFAIVFSNMK